ncbi:MAG: hypothetical protein BWZ03_00273 [bacterium ADurb.BinA186]|nr:MAG: hypothetical protein BWZ03_00273 [bacterium ADurb.BinA186]
MRYIQGADSNQATMLPEVVDDFIHEHNPVRVLVQRKVDFWG